jgi:4-hydroxybenzoate polyprenyltransferase
VSRGSLPGPVPRRRSWTRVPGWLSVLAVPRWSTCRSRRRPLGLVSEQKTLMEPLLWWVGVPAAAAAVGIMWAWLLGAIGPTYVWSIGVILVGVYYCRRARTESDRNFTLFITVSVLGIVLAAAILNALG